MTNFLVEHAFNAAQQILADQAHFYLSLEKWDEFAPRSTRRLCDLPELGSC
jgi:uncharacterized protein (DUF1778 family)